MSQQQAFNNGGLPGGSPIEFVNLDKGTSPISGPTITLTGAVVAAGTHPIRTDGTGPTTARIEVQFASALAATDATKVGMVSVDSKYFTIDPNGFVSLSAASIYISISPYIVGTDTHSGYATIASGIAAAVAGGATNSNPQNVYIKPKADGTPYAENLTLQPGVNLIGFGQIPTINGKLTYTQAGDISIQGLTLETNSDFAIAITGSAASFIYFSNCFVNAINNTAISYTSSSANSGLDFRNCFLDTAQSGIAIFDGSGSGNLAFAFSDVTNSGQTTTASTMSAGNLYVDWTQFESSIETSGSASFLSVESDFRVSNIPALVIGGSGGNNLYYGWVQSGSASGIFVNAPLTATFLTIDSTNTNALTGSSALSYSFISFIESSGYNVTTMTPLATLI